MGLKEIMARAPDVSGMAAGAAGRLMEDAGKLMDEFNEAIPTLRALGFTVKDLHVSIGLIPEVGARLVGTVDSINVPKVKELAQKNQGKKTLVALLKSLETAYNLRDQLSQADFRGVEINLKLGLPPRIEVDFLHAEAAKPAAVPQAA